MSFRYPQPLRAYPIYTEVSPSLDYGDPEEQISFNYKSISSSILIILLS